MASKKNASKARIPAFAVVNLYDVHSSSPEVDIVYFATYVEALDYVREVFGPEVFEEFRVGETDVWELEDEGWVRIDKVEVCS